MQTHPFISETFHIPWSQLSPEHVEADIKRALAVAEERLEAIRQQDLGALTYENSFGALELAAEELERGWGRLSHLDSVDDNPAQREAMNKMLPEVTAFSSKIPLDSAIWKVLKAYAESGAVSEQSEVRQRFIEETCADFRLSGADLADDTKAAIAEIDAALSQKTKKFSENVLDSTNAWDLVIHEEERLAGLPEMVKEAARVDALAQGHGSEDEPKWRFSLQHPSMAPVLQYAEDDALRREVWLASGGVGRDGGYDNSELIWEILELRQKKAELLGFDSFCDLILQRRMAKRGAAALHFVEDLHDRIEDQFQQECATLQSYKAQKTGAADEPLSPWEVSFWAEKQRKELYDFDDELLRPYFPVDKVMAGMFDIVTTLFGVRIEEVPTCFGQAEEGKVEVWAEDCQFYDVLDASNGEKLGSFYADWHPRPTKRGGAWMNSLETGDREVGGSRSPHLGLMVGNMTKPLNGKQALLDHREVETIFHEFGHLLHHLLSEVEVKSLAGTNVPWDFVELPSQIMENFCWDRESLNQFARHHETDAVIPDELFDKMVAAKNYMSATACMRQLSFGKLDLELHLKGAEYKSLGLDGADKAILQGYKIPTSESAPTIARRFSHLFSSPVAYASGYYSYKWAEVLDADAFTKFKEAGVLDPATGRAFRDEVLARGNSRPVDESFRAFMGRDPDLQALLVRSGLVMRS
ncbi:M3 family metallopeptidase [Rubritalea marina]|uniref:M3 family metallopeptidase n=1 Tax=Rubritalea marina TaxID=361055 RepID=UPI00037E6CC3|nr:M3 family metallopeptidase [Rubritalea marina]